MSLSFLLSLQYDKRLDNRTTLYKKIDEIRENIGLKKEDNNNLKDIIKKSNLAIVYETEKLNKNIKGLLDKPINQKPIILINKNIENKNFVLAHEFIHLLVAPPENNYHNTKNSSMYNYEEWRANEGAAQLLLPYKDFIYDYSYLYSFMKYEDMIKELSKIYSVSISVVEFRIKNLQNEIKQYLNGVDIEDITIL